MGFFTTASSHACRRGVTSASSSSAPGESGITEVMRAGAEFGYAH